MKLSIIGLGKLGAPMAAVMAHKGHMVVGVDVNPDYVAAIQHGHAPVRETGLEEMIQANRERLSATMDYEAGGSRDRCYVHHRAHALRSGG